MDNNSIIKLTLIDIFPSLEEIEQSNKEEISIIFQGLNNFYNLKDLLFNRKDIYIKKNIPKKSLLISLVQSVDILATGTLNIKTGKQWVTFSYENKKKLPQSNLALSLMDCIKINISCLIIYNNSQNYRNTIINNTNKGFNKIQLNKKCIKKNLAQKKISKNIILKNNKENIINNKHKYNNSQEHFLINSYNYNGRDVRDSLYSIENEKKINFKVKRDYNFINIDSFSTIGKENKKFDLNSSLSLSSNKYSHKHNMSIIEQNKMYSTIRQKFSNYNFNNSNNSLYDNQSNNINDFVIEPKIEIREEHNILKKNKTNNQFKLNAVHKKQKSCNTLKITENKNLRYKNGGDKNAFKNNNNDSNKKFSINNTVQRKNSKINIISNTNYPPNIDRNNLYSTSSLMTKSFFKKNELMNSFQKDNNSKNANNKNTNDNYITEKKNIKTINNINLNNINNTILFNSNNKINTEINNNVSRNILYNQTVDNMDNENLENDNYNKLKEDFLLLYTNDYVKNVKEDLLKLEIELFVEKMTEITREYHMQLYYYLLEYEIEKNKYQINLSNYSEINKLYNKLISIKTNQEIKKNNINERNKIFIKQKNEFNKINKNEINLYNILFNNNSNKIIENKIKLKIIFNNIINKFDIKNIINPDNKNFKKIINYLKMNKTLEHNQLIRSRIIPKNQQTKCNTNQSFTNSYLLENNYDKKDNDVYTETHIFSPILNFKDITPNTISKIKFNFNN